MSNRSTVSIMYKVDEDGLIIRFGSTKGNEKLVEKHAKVIGKNVLVTLYINFAMYKEIEGGYEITTVMCASPNGSIPQALINKQAAKNASQPYNLWNLMVNGVSPTD